MSLQHLFNADEKESSKTVLALITAKLVTIDGMAIGDAFELGQLIQKYGMLCSSEGAMNIMKPILEKMGEKEQTDEPWKKKRGE